MKIISKLGMQGQGYSLPRKILFAQTQLQVSAPSHPPKHTRTQTSFFSYFHEILQKFFKLYWVAPLLQEILDPPM